MANSAKSKSGKIATIINEVDSTGCQRWKPSVGETLLFRKTNGRANTYIVESSVGRGCVGCDVRDSKFDTLCEELLCEDSKTILKKKLRTLKKHSNFMVY